MSKILYADDDTESTKTLLKLRTPGLLLGLILGILIFFLTSSFERVLSENIKVAFFLPFIVYLADAIGTQTQSIYARDLKSRKTKFHNYLIKESILGMIFGTIFGSISGIIIFFWLSEKSLALSVSLSIFITGTFAPLIALIISQIIYKLKNDPAVDAGPIATVIQDMLSIVVYGIISSILIL